MERLLRAAVAVLLLGSHAEAYSVSSDCPVRLLEVGGEQEGTFALQEKALDYLAAQKSPLYVIPVLGVFRSGKSFALNRLRRLSTPYSGGFGVGHGQDTFTRGIYVCAEFVEDLGTIVWMDTEGLFSAEHATSTYGPKIFSLALLFSSTVVLNSVKVLSDLFFTFFAEQQQVARMLRQGLAHEGLPEGDLLPRNLTVVWLLQQPVCNDEDVSDAAETQLDVFLSGDEARQRVKDDFNHHLAVLPVATHDSRLWPQLNFVEEHELNPAFISGIDSLRSLILQQLQNARPMQAKAVVGQLRMYAGLVQTSNFSSKLTKEALEQSQLASACEAYAKLLRLLAGRLPSANVSDAITSARPDAEVNGAWIADHLHLEKPWRARLRTCLDHAEDDLREENDGWIEAEWRKEANQLAEQGDCYFLHGLMDLYSEIQERYRCTFSADVYEKILQHAIALQRARLMDCLRVKHFLWPLAPWFASPLLAFYVRNGFVSGLWQLLVHVILVTGIYVVVNAFGHLPPMLDVEYPVLQQQPQILDVVLEAAPRVPWALVGQGIHYCGILYFVVKLLMMVQHFCRPAGDPVAGMISLELKLNKLIQHHETIVQQQFLATCQDAQAYADRGDDRATGLAMLRALSMFTDAGSAAGGEHVTKEVRGRIRALLADPSVASNRRIGVCQNWHRRAVLGKALSKNWTGAIVQMVEILEGAESSRR
mmetsp:Transcript_9333/g.16866  ORF Transcript_9333/g.16866 Transcript_9333/m.16866 type:complete len:706 (+) Transcript_9333:39-2156(+)